MHPVLPLPRTGEVFLDARSDRRALRVSWHHEQALVVLSLWRDNVCAATFRVRVEDVPDLVGVLRDGLEEAYRLAAGGSAASPPRADLPGAG